MLNASRLLAALTITAAASPALAEPPGFTMARTGAKTDFDYFRGGWATQQHRLRPDGTWHDYPAVECMTPYLDGGATIDELYMPAERRAGLTLRSFDLKARQWSIYWVNGATGVLDPIPTVGGFEGKRGEFYARDTVGGKPVKVRYLWMIDDQDHARWEQALSYDDATWQTNWKAEFTRADPAKVCDHGRPRR